MDVHKIIIADIDQRPSDCPDRHVVKEKMDTDDRSTEITRDSDDGSGDDDFQVKSSLVVISEDATNTTHRPDKQHVRETYFHTRRFRDSIDVQTHHKANDDERHEENPHLEDYLIPDHSVHVERAKSNCCIPITETAHEEEKCCEKGILHEEATIPDSQESAKPKPTRKVQFGTVLVRDYDMILGEHPCCSYGPPITIDWDYLEYKPIEVDEYEFHHGERRGLREMMLNYYARKEILSNAGFTEIDIKQVTKKVNREKLNRSITKQIVHHYPLFKAEAAVESACRKFKRLIKDDHWKNEKSLYVKTWYS